MTGSAMELVLVAGAMLAAGALGYWIARERFLRRTRNQLSMMSSEVMRMRRRTQTAERDTKRLKEEAVRSRRNMRRAR